MTASQKGMVAAQQPSFRIGLKKGEIISKGRVGHQGLKLYRKKNGLRLEYIRTHGQS